MKAVEDAKAKWHISTCLQIAESDRASAQIFRVREREKEWNCKKCYSWWGKWTLLFLCYAICKNEWCQNKKKNWLTLRFWSDSIGQPNWAMNFACKLLTVFPMNWMMMMMVPMHHVNKENKSINANDGWYICSLASSIVETLIFINNFDWQCRFKS